MSVIEDGVRRDMTEDFVVEARQLGSAEFCRDYGLSLAYVAGAMYKGIASKELVVALGKSGFIGYLGTGGLRHNEVEAAIEYIQANLTEGQPYGMNLLANNGEQYEDTVVDMYLKYGVTKVEASSYMTLSPSLIRYRLQGLREDGAGQVVAPNKVMAKLSRPEVALQFMSPAPTPLVEKLLSRGQITQEEARLSKKIPVAQEVTVEADSGGHTDQGVALAIFPAIKNIASKLEEQYSYSHRIKVGSAGGIGTPEAIVAAFSMGADFVVTGSINQCTREAGISDPVKDLLQNINIQDTDYAPAGDLFEMGAKVQVMKKGVFFPARANKLYDLYMNHNSLDEIDPKTIDMIEKKYFKRSIESVWEETLEFHRQHRPEEYESIVSNPKRKMSAIFRWYFVRTSRLALSGDDSSKVDYQIHTGPALGAFNQWVKGTDLETWRNRGVAQIAQKIMVSAATLQSAHIQRLLSNSVL